MKQRKRIVLKIGTLSLLDDDENISKNKIEKFCDFIVRLQKKYEVILVSSGAVGFGYSQLKLDRSKLGNKQALAAIGQSLLMNEYNKNFEKNNILIAQILLKKSNFLEKESLENVSRTVKILLSKNVIPIINENDSVATEELVFGDNDNLAAYCTKYFKAELLVLVTDIDALYDKDPSVYVDARKIKKLDFISKKLLADNKNSQKGDLAMGGIYTKLKAVEFLLKDDTDTFLTSNSLVDVKNLLLKNKHTGGTLFSKKLNI